MTAFELRFQRTRFVLETPQDLSRELSLLYHRSLIELESDAEESIAARFELVAEDGAWTLRNAEDAAPLGTFEEPILALLRLEHELEARRLAARDEREIAFHAGAVVTPAGACLVAGTADVGKSSTTLQLVELDCPFLAEEIAIVDTDGRVVPHLQTLAIDPRVTAEIEQEHPIRRGRIEVVASLLERYLPDRVSHEPSPLATVVLPSYQPGGAPLLERVTVEDVVTELLGFCFEPLGEPEATIDRVVELAGGVQLWRLQYPDAPTARRLLLRLLDGNES